jgi:hypothetical protein
MRLDGIRVARALRKLQLRRGTLLEIGRVMIAHRAETFMVWLW